LLAAKSERNSELEGIVGVASHTVKETTRKKPKLVWELERELEQLADYCAELETGVGNGIVRLVDRQLKDHHALTEKILNALERRERGKASREAVRTESIVGSPLLSLDELEADMADMGEEEEEEEKEEEAVGSGEALQEAV